MKRIVQSAFLVLYELIVFLCSPVALCLFLFSQRGRTRISERLGMPTLGAEPVNRWWHVASLGEINGLLPVLRAIGAGVGDLITVTSPSALCAEVPPGVRIRIAPFDCRLWYLLLFWRSGGPQQLIISETEIHPAMIHFVASRGGAVGWINMRCRQHSSWWYRMISRLVEPDLRRGLFAVASSADQQRLAHAFPDSVKDWQVLGNSKYDRAPSVTSKVTQDKLREQLGLKSSQQLITLASVHLDEFESLLPALRRLAGEFVDARFLLAPRHRERDADFLTTLRRSALSVAQRTKGERLSAEVSFLLLDSFGELEPLYSISTVVFVGGSLNHVGGHNPLEAAQYGVPLLMGPYREVVAELAEQLEMTGALRTIYSGSEFADVVGELLTDPFRRARAGEAALQTAISHRGATERIVSALRAWTLSATGKEGEAPAR